MGAPEIFIIRLAISIIIALLICRFFCADFDMLKVFILALVMLGLAYLLEYFRKKDEGGN